MRNSEVQIRAGVLLTLMVAFEAPARSENLIYTFDMEDPIAWSDVALPWGAGGTLDWIYADGGNPGKALRITTAINRQVVSNEGRCLNFNHEPGTPARIQFDVRIIAMPANGQIKVGYYDGYVTALAFDALSDSEFDRWPKPIFLAGSKSDHQWRHVDFKTPPLKNTVLSLAVFVSDPTQDAKEHPDAAEYPDILIDNLKVDTVVSSSFRDPGFDWHGRTGRKMIECRCSTFGADLDWCDLMQEEDVPNAKGKITHFTMATFRDTASQPPGHIKHDYEHEVSQIVTGGVSVISLSNVHADASAASWGIRQTFSYAALGLKPREPAKITINVRDTVHDPAKSHIAKLMIGCDPNGQILPTRAKWSPESSPNWDEKGWQIQTLEIERPVDAVAMTFYWKMRDGRPSTIKLPNGQRAEDPDSEATKPGCRGIADWVLIKAEPQLSVGGPQG